MDSRALDSLPDDLPVPPDDGAAAHLRGMAMPALTLPATDGTHVDLAALGAFRTVLYCYPRTGVPGTPLPTGWDEIPGARGCTVQAQTFRNHLAQIEALDAAVYGVSTQTTEFQREAAERLHLSFPLLSDADLKLVAALRLPTFGVDGMTLMRRLTLIVRDGAIEHVFYPVFPPDRNAADVARWLTEHRL